VCPQSSVVVVDIVGCSVGGGSAVGVVGPGCEGHLSGCGHGLSPQSISLG